MNKLLIVLCVSIVTLCFVPNAHAQTPEPAQCSVEPWDTWGHVSTGIYFYQLKGTVPRRLATRRWPQRLVDTRPDLPRQDRRGLRAPPRTDHCC